MSRDPEQIVAWAREHPGCGFHAPCGPNGLVVVDQDVKRSPSGELVADGRRAWRAAGGPRSSMSVTTQSGGRQFYFRAPEEPIRNSAKALAGVPGVDVRGDGGTVFVSGSQVHGGGHYVAERIVPVAELPALSEAWAERLRSAGPRGERRRAATRSSSPTRRSSLVPASTIHGREWVEAKYADLLRVARGGRTEFRAHLLAAALVGFRAADLGLIDEVEVRTDLHEAVGCAWGAEPDADDRQWIEQARADASEQPWRLARDERAGAVEPTSEPDRVPTGALPTLPDEFWSARKSLEHVRRAAHARCASADVVLHAVLARLASQRHHETRVDTGLRPAVLNLFTAAVGPSGAGKSSAVEVARELLPAEFAIAGGDGYRDAVPVGSGEGLAELFMGTRDEATGETYRGGPHKGEDRTRPVRAQVRHNALVWVDEGEALFRMADRKGATIMPTLRSAWTGGVLGQSNASAETTRLVPAGSYALGLVIGVQVDTAGPLFADEAGGTPQRFLFCSATDPSIPDDGPVWPGELELVPDEVGESRSIPVTDAGVLAAVRAEHLARHRGEGGERDPLDAHRPLHFAKVAALLAVLDGRREVDAEDWSLAGQVWATSCAVRSSILERGRDLERDRAERRTEAFVDREARAALARDQASAKVARLADRLRAWVADGEHARSALRRKLPHRDRGLYEDAVEHGVGEGWLVRTAAGLELGPVTP